MTAIRNLTALEVLMTVQGIYEQLSKSTSAKTYRIGILSTEAKPLIKRLELLKQDTNRAVFLYPPIFKEMEVTTWELPGEASDNLTVVYIQDIFMELCEFLITNEEIHSHDTGICPDLVNKISVAIDNVIYALQAGPVFFLQRRPVVVAKKPPLIEELVEAANEEMQFRGMMGREATDADNSL